MNVFKTVVEVWLPYNPKSETYNVTKAGYRALISAPWYLDYIRYTCFLHLAGLTNLIIVMVPIGRTTTSTSH